MPFLEVLAVQVGSAVAKSILKLWLKDSSIASDTSSAIVDLLSTKTNDYFARQAGETQLKKIGLKTAESLKDIFEREGTDLDEGSYEAIAYEVAHVLEATPISVELLLEQNLQPERLYTYLKSSNPKAVQHFSYDEEILFNRVLEEACQFIVDISSNFPAFTQKTFAEVLNREDQLVNIATDILQEVRLIRLASERENPEKQAALFETKYRRTIIRNLDRLELFGADVSNLSRRQRLSVAYISLTVQGEHDDIFSIEQLLDNDNYHLIKGPAGSGKTSLLKWIAVASSSKSFEGNLTRLNEKVPFFIRLRKCNDGNFPNPEEFAQLEAPHISGEMPTTWVHKLLNEGKAIILVDGIDEVSQAQRSELHKWLTNLIEEFPNNLFVVTSRNQAVENNWEVRKEVKVSELNELELEQIFALVDNWHIAVQENIQSEQEHEVLDEYATKLKDIIKTTRAIRNLATNPLLCAMICALHKDKSGNLPKDRIELYQKCVSLLVEDRDKSRGIILEDYPDLSYRQKLVLLQDLAYHLMRNGLSEIPISDAIGRVEKRLKNLHDLPSKTSAERIVRLFLERTGIVREPTAGKLDFTHRTFQEYLTAEQIVNDDDFGFLIRNAFDDQWRETIVLAAGVSSKPIREEKIIGELIKQGDQRPHLKQQLHLLAVACLETSVEISTEIRQELDKRLKKLIPPKNITEAKTIARAGDLAVPHLARHVRARATTAAACVRALCMIGSESSLVALERFSKDKRRTVQRELFRGWRYFTQEDYAKYVGKNMYIDSFATDTTAGLEYLQSLKKLTLAIRVGNLSKKPLQLERLQELRLRIIFRNSEDFDFTSFSSLTNLTNLTLSIYSSSQQSHLNLTKISNLTNLTELNTNISSRRDLPTPLITWPNFTNLQNLYRVAIRGRFVRDFSVLDNLTYLHHLSFETDMSDLTSLSHLVELRSLEVLGNHQPLDLNFVVQLNHLENLELSNWGAMSNITELEKLSSLTTLVLEATTMITKNEFRALCSLTSLTTLFLNMPIDRTVDLMELHSLPNLLHLSIPLAQLPFSVNNIQHFFNFIEGFPSLLFLEVPFLREWVLTEERHILSELNELAQSYGIVTNYVLH